MSRTNNAKFLMFAEYFRLAYDANVHGWNPASFHQQVDTFGASIVLAETEGGAVLGGYNPSGK